MTTRIVESGPLPLVQATRTAPRVTPAPSEPFSAVMRAGARAVVDSAEGAVWRLPGGPVLAAAFRDAPPAVGSSSHALSSAESSAEGTSGPGAGGFSGDIQDPAGEVLAQNSDQNLYYLRLQQQISAESREYTALSNVLKARHDTVKNAIGNIR